MGVGAALCSLLINACENQLGYSKPLVLLHDGVSVNATCAVGVNGSAPASAPDQPFLLPGTRYCFDSKFRGVDGFGPLCIALADSCTDCLLLLQLLISLFCCQEPDTVLILNFEVWMLLDHCALHLPTAAQTVLSILTKTVKSPLVRTTCVTVSGAHATRFRSKIVKTSWRATMS